MNRSRYWLTTVSYSTVLNVLGILVNEGILKMFGFKTLYERKNSTGGIVPLLDEYGRIGRVIF